jgi:hypothetical protein
VYVFVRIIFVLSMLQKSKQCSVVLPGALHSINVSMFGLKDLPTTTVEDKKLFHGNLKRLFNSKKKEYLEGKVPQEEWDAIEKEYVASDDILAQTLY